MRMAAASLTCAAGGADDRDAFTETVNVIAAGLSLPALGPEGRARQQRDAAAIRENGSTPLVVALAAPRGDDVETLLMTAGCHHRRRLPLPNSLRRKPSKNHATSGRC